MHKKSALRSVGWLLLLSGSAGIAADTAPPGASVPPGFVEWPANHIPWQPLPAIHGGEVAMLLGKPSEAGPIVLRVQLPPNTQVAAHIHPEARTYTVLDGEWKLGFGDKYNAAILRSYTAGSVYRLPAKVPHFQATGPSGATVQIESIGPTRTQFIEATRGLSPASCARMPCSTNRRA